MSTYEAVIRVLKEKGNWLSTSEIADLVEKSPKTVQKVIKKLKDEGKLLIKEESLGGAAKRYFYKLRDTQELVETVKDTTEAVEETLEVEEKSVQVEKNEKRQENEKIGKATSVEESKTFIVKLNGIQIASSPIPLGEIKKRISELRREFQGANFEISETDDSVVLDIKAQFRTKG